ncbi:MAG: hypothetical protein GY797_38955 [Deltaproteobacteria bacterium]|nr:hypothetical protein [Deltaproteobacteria bacterium]
MDYTQAIVDLAGHHMTPEGFTLLMNIEARMPDIWNKPSASTGKYHKKADGSVPTIAHHTYEMLYAGTKIIRMFGGKLKSVQNDVYVMAIVLHDIQKYGPKGNMPHTNNYHDRSMADLLEKNIRVFTKHFSDYEAEKMIQGVRYHSGRWSKSVPNMHEFDFADYDPIVMFTHMLDMMSTADVLQFPEVDNEGR